MQKFVQIQSTWNLLNPMCVLTEMSTGGMVEYWSGSNNEYNFPKSVSFESKVETDLYEFAKGNIGPILLKIILLFKFTRKRRQFKVVLR